MGSPREDSLKGMFIAGTPEKVMKNGLTIYHLPNYEVFDKPILKVSSDKKINEIKNK